MKIGPKLKQPELALDARRPPRSGERSRELGAGPQTLSALRRASMGALISFFLCWCDRCLEKVATLNSS
jgi:hypothetical protein